MSRMSRFTGTWAPVFARLALPGGARPDLLGAGWRLAASRTALPVAVALVALLLLSAVAAPSLYLRPSEALGMPLSAWPASAVRVAALLRAGGAPWGKAALALLFVCAVASAAARLAGAVALRPEPAWPGGERSLSYSEAPEARVRRLHRAVLALLGYRGHAVADEPAAVHYESRSPRRFCRGVAAAALALLSLAALIWPKVVATESATLIPGGRWAVAARPGLTLAVEAAASGLAFRGEGDAAAAVLRPGGLDRLAGLVVAWHGQGPALVIRPAGEQAGQSGERVAIAFLPGERSRLVTLAEGDAALRVALAEGASPLQFDVTLVSGDDLSPEATYRLSRATTLRLAGMLLAFEPAEYYVLSVWRVPLLAPALVAATALAASLLLSLVWRGAPLRICYGSHGGVVAVAIEAAAPLPRRLVLLRWLRRMGA